MQERRRELVIAAAHEHAFDNALNHTTASHERRHMTATAKPAASKPAAAKPVDWTKPAAMAIPKEGFFKLEQGTVRPDLPETPACYGFTIIAKIKPGREQAIP
jgi:hypothetical protein